MKIEQQRVNELDTPKEPATITCVVDESIDRSIDPFQLSFLLTFWYPQITRSSIKNDLKGLRWTAHGDRAIILSIGIIFDRFGFTLLVHIINNGQRISRVVEVRRCGTTMTKLGNGRSHFRWILNHLPRLRRLRRWNRFPQ